MPSGIVGRGERTRMASPWMGEVEQRRSSCRMRGPAPCTRDGSCPAFHRNPGRVAQPREGRTHAHGEPMDGRGRATQEQLPNARAGDVDGCIPRGFPSVISVARGRMPKATALHQGRFLPRIPTKPGPRGDAQSGFRPTPPTSPHPALRARMLQCDTRRRTRPHAATP